MNRKVANFKLPSTGDKDIQLKDFIGQKVVIFFYPKDSTPGCTQESCEFSSSMAKLAKCNAVVWGVSRDSIASHEKFKKNQKLKMDLLSDENEKLCKQFDVIKEKNMYGKKFMGIERSTFVLDEDHKLAAEWRKVKVKGHVDEVLEFVKGM